MTYRNPDPGTRGEWTRSFERFGVKRYVHPSGVSVEPDTFRRGMWRVDGGPAGGTYYPTRDAAESAALRAAAAQVDG